MLYLAESCRLPCHIAPNPRLQRTPSAAPPSPLSRKPLGVTPAESLVEKLPSQGEPGPFEMVTVLETGDQSLIAVARSLLESAGIPCIARNEVLQNLLAGAASARDSTLPLDRSGFRFSRKMRK